MVTPMYFVSVEVEELNVRPGPDTTGAPVATLPHGTVLAVLAAGAEQRPWIQVASTDGAVQGWINGSLAQRVPMLVVDLYRGDCDGRPRWSDVAADWRYCGAILKATEGVSYDGSWFIHNWPLVKQAAGARYGQTFFRGAYHYLLFGEDAAKQADFYLNLIEKDAGGWDAGDFIPIVDVERGSEHGPNYGSSAQQIVDTTSAFVARVAAATGQAVMLYGRGAMRDRGISSRMGAAHLWNPGYTKVMPATSKIGWPTELVSLWQFSDGTSNATSYPATAPALGPVDHSVFLAGDYPDLRATILRRPA